jgi:preprotein translocase subunit YajC
MTPILFAQTGGGGASGGLGMGAFLFQVLAIIAIFYFILIRPQQKERKRLEAAILGIKKGDEIVTSGGIIGEVMHIHIQRPGESNDQGPTLNDRVTIKSGESKLVIERGRIARVNSKTP